MRRMLLALTITLVLSFAFGSALVFAANAAAPGDPLYRMDRELEAIQLELARNQQNALQLKEKLASERLVELQSLVASGNQQALDESLAELGLALSALEQAANGGGMQPGGVAGLVNNAFAPGGNIDPKGNAYGNGNSDDDGDGTIDTKDGAYCRSSEGKHHPTGEKLAERYEVGYDEIMGWFCDGGYGFGEIDLGYRISQAAGVTPTAVFDKRLAGMGWGNILKEYGLDKKPDKPPKPAKPPEPGNGNGNGGGNSGGNGNGQGNGQANGHDKPPKEDKGNKGKP